MIYWAPLLHFYQPPTQTASMLMKISNESYRPLVDVFGEFSHARATVNINGVLTEMLGQCGYSDVLAKLRKLAEDGQIEFTGSGKYHPILPLIPTEEVERQIRLNYQTNRSFLGDAYVPRGFFPPEMCYSRDIINPIIESRHEWIILSGIACPVAWPMDVIHEISSGHDRLAVFFRDDILSNKISFRNIDGPGFIEHLKRLHSGEGDVYVVTAMDAETFGHHIQHWDKLFLAQIFETLEPMANRDRTMHEQKPLAEQHRRLFEFEKDKEDRQIRIVTVSELLEIFPKGKQVEPKPSSWSTSADDIKMQNYYPLWKDKNNQVHQMQWEHLSIAMDLTHKAVELADNDTSVQFAGIARTTLDAALHSCQFWWASKKPMWDVNMVYRGLNLQREALLNAYKVISASRINPELKKEYYYRALAARHIFVQITDSLYMD
jgi:alpha-amylase/alpha-mannosidase (GH57 family)